jgi:hypothetical protein
MKHKRIGKTSVILLASIIALAMSGATYALWYEDLYIYTDIETGEVDWEFWHPSWYVTPGIPEFPLFIHEDNGIDPGWTKDVGSNWAEFLDLDEDGDFETMHLVFENVYPGYWDHFTFSVHCNGNIPIHIWKVEFTNLDGTIIYGTFYDSNTASQGIYIDIDGSGGDDVWIWWGDNFGDQLHYCHSRDLSFIIQFLQPCPQNAHLDLVIHYVACQYNEYVPGPIE